MLQKMAVEQGCGDTFYKTDVAVYFGEGPGKEHPDPYFGGEGPPRLREGLTLAPFATTGLFGLVSLSLASWLFRRKDF